MRHIPIITQAQAMSMKAINQNKKPIMRKIILILFISAFLAACSNSGTGKPVEQHQHDFTAAKTANKKSISSEAKKWVGNTDIKINYHAPAVRGLVIWGGLVPCDDVWVTGAYKATTSEVGKNFKVGDKVIPAGKYALFTIPGKEEWPIILNRNWNQHMADDYSEAEAVVRLKVKPEATNQITKRLNYTIDQTGERIADIIICWEKLKVVFGVEVL